MNYDLVKSCLNLYAVLKNLEDLCELDTEMKELISSLNLSIQFSVRGGPKAFVKFKEGKCEVGRGGIPKPSIILFFLSPGHLNRMFQGEANPIPLRGITKLGFLTGDFTRLTSRLEYYLKPSDELMKNSSYAQLNVRMTLNTAAFAIPEIVAWDNMGRRIASKIPAGTVEMSILPSFHSVNITYSEGNAAAATGPAENPMALMEMKNLKVAGDFFNSISDPFTAIASGDVVIRGIIPMLDSTSMLLDRVQYYLA